MTVDSKTLAVNACDRCGALAAWPRHACIACGSTCLTRAFASGGGRIQALTLIHRAPISGDGPVTPYAVALIALEIGGTLMARVPAFARIGDAVVASRQQPTAMPDIALADANT